MNFMTSCHIHGSAPDASCVECRTSRDVIRMGHAQGNCISYQCIYHLVESGRVRRVDSFWFAT